MVLMIPSELKKDINKNSGYLNYTSKYGNKTFKYLFLSDINEKFLSNQVFRLLINQKYINQVNSDTEYYMNSYNFNDNLRLLFKKNKPFVFDIMRSFMINMKMPHFEDHLNLNPIDILSNINTDFILSTSKNIIQNPEIIESEYYDINPDTGKKDIHFKGFGANSYSSGYWEPEKLFTDTANNRKNPYWVPRETSFTVRPPGAPFSAFGKQDYSENGNYEYENVYNNNHRYPTPVNNKRGKLTKKDVYGNSGHAYNSERFQNTRDFREDSKLARRKTTKIHNPLLNPIANNYDEIDANGGDYVDMNNYGHNTLEQTLLSKDPINMAYTDFTKHDAFTDIDPLGVSAGNRYMYDFYGDYTNADKQKRGFSKGGVIPPWQYTMNSRHYSKTSEGLREGGEGDRRVNFQVGCGDMSALMNKSTY